MFDIGWTEMLVIAVVMIVVVGPKDLPRMLRTFGKTTAKLRAMAGDFQKQFNEALKEAELDDVKKSVDELRSLNPANEIRKQLNPFEKAAADVRAGLDKALKPSTPVAPADTASAVTHAAEPLKNGATAMPGVAGPEAMPVAPVIPATNDVAASAAAAGPAVAVAALPAAAATPPGKAKPKRDPKPAPGKEPSAKKSPAKAAAAKAPIAGKTATPKSVAPKKAVAAKPVAKTTKASAT